MTLIPGVEMIDASQVKTDFLAHAYHASASPVLSDIKKLLNDRKRADQRGLTSVVRRSGRYWLITENGLDRIALSN